MFRKRLIKKAIRSRFIVTLPANEGVFSGVLVEHDGTFWVFDDCATVPQNVKEGTPSPIAGRVWIKHNVSPTPYLQEM
jgi:hypothetical protein